MHPYYLSIFLNRQKYFFLLLTNQNSSESTIIKVKNKIVQKGWLTMKSQAKKQNVQVESSTPDKIVLDEKAKYPKDVVFRNKHGDIKLYRLVETKSGGLVLNK